MRFGPSRWREALDLGDLGCGGAPADAQVRMEDGKRGGETSEVGGQPRRIRGSGRRSEVRGRSAVLASLSGCGRNQTTTTRSRAFTEANKENEERLGTGCTGFRPAEDRRRDELPALFIPLILLILSFPVSGVGCLCVLRVPVVHRVLGSRCNPWSRSSPWFQLFFCCLLGLRLCDSAAWR